MVTRVPTYMSHMNSINNALRNKAIFNLYNFQSMTGLKSSTYAGYGMKAYNVVSSESALNLVSNFMENNKVVETETKLINTSLNSCYEVVNDFKSMLSKFSSGGLNNITPDYTGGKLIFGNDTVADYYGKTLTIDGTQYTFTNGAGGATDIDISGATNGEDIMNALQTALPANVDFKFDGNTFEFPLYTVNGTSSVLNVTGVETGEPHTMSPDQYASVKELQNLAFATMQMLADNLNIQSNGKYLFGGGVSNTTPVDFPFNNIEQFQAYYDGLNITYPNNSASDLSNRSYDSSVTGSVTLELDAPNSNTGTITAANTGAFLNEAIVANANTTGDLTFDISTNSLKATEYGAFNTLKAGDTLVIGGAASGTNSKAYIIKSVSADGKTVTFEESTPVVSNDVISPNDDVTFSTSFPVGSVINMDGFGNNIASQVQITGISDDGTTLYVTADPSRFPANGSPVTVTSDFSMSNESYYQGGDLSYEKRISENQVLVYDVNANDPVFEKIFRALGQIAQGNFVDTRNPAEDLTTLINPNQVQDRVNEALDLVFEALYDPSSSAKNADLHTVMAKMANNQIVLDNTVNNQTLIKADLENNISSLKTVDTDEAAAMAIVANNNLQASYSVLSQALKSSLLDYI